MNFQIPWNRYLLPFLLLLSVSCSNTTQKVFSPPPPQILEDLSNPETQNYIASEMLYSKNYFHSNRYLLREITNELLMPKKEDKITIGNYNYYQEEQQGLKLPIIWRNSSTSNSRQLVLDPNPICKTDLCSLGFLKINPSGDLVAFSLQQAREPHILFIKDLTSQEIITTGIDNVYDLAWENNSQFLISKTELGLPNSIYKVSFPELKEKLIKKSSISLTLQSSTQATSKKITTWDNSGFISKLYYAISRDGATKIPITVIESKNTPKIAPILAVVYGAYGKEPFQEPEPWLISLLMRDFRIAIIHVRGGGFYGEKWHKAGSKDNKINSIYDFNDSLKYLSGQAFVEKNNIFAYARSAGGYIVATSLTSSEKILNAAVLDHAFLDLKRARDRSDLLASFYDLSEWGASSPLPLEELKRKLELPNLLLFTSAHDQAVPAWHTLRWASAVSSLNKAKMLIDFSLTATHNESATAFEKAEKEAKIVTFLIENRSDS